MKVGCGWTSRVYLRIIASNGCHLRWLEKKGELTSFRMVSYFKGGWKILGIPTGMSMEMILTMVIVSWLFHLPVRDFDLSNPTIKVQVG